MLLGSISLEVGARGGRVWKSMAGWRKGADVSENPWLGGEGQAEAGM